MGANYPSGSDYTRPGTTPSIDDGTGGTTPIPPPTTSGSGSAEDPYWYTPTNVYLPPGVDPYYGVSITGLNGSSGGGTAPPTYQDGTGGGKDISGDHSYNSWGEFLGTSPDWKEYQNYSYNATMMGETPIGFTTWQALKNSNSSSNTGSGTGGASGDFRIARPNMTWNNNLPTIAPANGQAALNAYAPLPFTREANTPGVNYVKPQLTYNNPYNTNPYLPTANPFALIANTPTSGS